MALPMAAGDEKTMTVVAVVVMDGDGPHVDGDLSVVPQPRRNPPPQAHRWHPAMRPRTLAALVSLAIAALHLMEPCSHAAVLQVHLRAAMHPVRRLRTLGALVSLATAALHLMGSCKPAAAVQGHRTAAMHPVMRLRILVALDLVAIVARHPMESCLPVAVQGHRHRPPTPTRPLSFESMSMQSVVI